MTDLLNQILNPLLSCIISSVPPTALGAFPIHSAIYKKGAVSVT